MPERSIKHGRKIKFPSLLNCNWQLKLAENIKQGHMFLLISEQCFQQVNFIQYKKNKYLHLVYDVIVMDKEKFANKKTSDQ